jgi:hypothetical protein
MYNKKDIVKTLHEFNYFIDELTLSNFIKNWKIDPIYEDEDRIEFFDNFAIIKLKKGISLKAQGYSDDQIIFHINKILTEKTTPEKDKKELSTGKNFTGELQNLTIDVTNQTLQMLADAVAQKIAFEIKDQIQNADFVKQLLEDTTLKKDNEILAKKVEELGEDNKKLAKKIKEIERLKSFSPINFEYFKKFFK